jgi:hypothetical protein
VLRAPLELELRLHGLRACPAGSNRRGLGGGGGGGNFSPQEYGQYIEEDDPREIEDLGEIGDGDGGGEGGANSSMESEGVAVQVTRE